MTAFPSRWGLDVLRLNRGKENCEKVLTFVCGCDIIVLSRGESKPSEDGKGYCLPICP